MSGGSDQPAGGEKIPTPGLVVLTGASHTGKTSVARVLLDLLPPPVALLGVDALLAHVLLRPPGDRWEQIPLAYELLVTEADLLLGRGWTVVIESTFTYVPEQGSPQFHMDAIRRLREVAKAHHRPFLLAQLILNRDETLRRSRETGRLAPEIVAQTVALHDRATLPGQSLRLAAESQTPDALAAAVLTAMRDLG